MADDRLHGGTGRGASSSITDNEGVRVSPPPTHDFWTTLPARWLAATPRGAVDGKRRDGTASVDAGGAIASPAPAAGLSVPASAIVGVSKRNAKARHRRRGAGTEVTSPWSRGQFGHG